jgi:predicted DNA-binding transcriptional regulator YafY
MGWKTERLLAITLLLQGSKKYLTANDLAKILEVSKRTIYRDIQSLSIAGVPIIESPGPHGGYTLSEDYKLDFGLFTKDETVSLFLGTTMIEQYSPLNLAKTAKSALIKIKSYLPQDYKKYIQSVKEKIIFDISTLTENTYLKILENAIFKHKRLKINYKTNCKIPPT